VILRPYRITFEVDASILRHLLRKGHLAGIRSLVLIICFQAINAETAAFYLWGPGAPSSSDDSIGQHDGSDEFDAKGS
jgi:hypothetical protein